MGVQNLLERPGRVLPSNRKSRDPAFANAHLTERRTFSADHLTAPKGRRQNHTGHMPVPTSACKAAQRCEVGSVQGVNTTIAQRGTSSVSLVASIAIETPACLRSAAWSPSVLFRVVENLLEADPDVVLMAVRSVKDSNDDVSR